MNTPRTLRGLRLVASLAVLAAILACGGGDSDDAPPAPVAPAPLPVAPAPAVAPAPPAGGTTLVNLSTGFMPDPHTTTGTAGGPLMASTLDPNCRGNVPNAPQHTLMLGTDFQSLRVMVNSQADATLVIRGPDGVYRCNDDSDGLMPEVTGAFSPGTYQVWVGVFAGTPTPYTIGFSEIPSVRATSLALP